MAVMKIECLFCGFGFDFGFGLSPNQLPALFDSSGRLAERYIFKIYDYDYDVDVCCRTIVMVDC